MCGICVVAEPFSTYSRCFYRSTVSTVVEQLTGEGRGGKAVPSLATDTAAPDFNTALPIDALSRWACFCFLQGTVSTARPTWLLSNHQFENHITSTRKWEQFRTEENKNGRACVSSQKEWFDYQNITVLGYSRGNTVKQFPWAHVVDIYRSDDLSVEL